MQQPEFRHTTTHGPRVLRLAQAEQLELDQDRLVELSIDLGEVEAERGLIAALTRIGDRLDRIEARIADGQGAAAIGHCHDIARLADRMGLISLARAAQAVATCIATDDPIALAATRARLYRQIMQGRQAGQVFHDGTV